ncbi:MAG: rubredoxin [Candidatus Lokiarchaeota archaeon]|nr:rubredoxin [Candidatus Lokiarchaeota archaeon]
MSRFRCSVCNFIYEEEKEGKNFTDLPNSWTCSVCGALKTAFLLEGFSKGDEGIEKNVTERISNKKLIRKK